MNDRMKRPHHYALMISTAVASVLPITNSALAAEAANSQSPAVGIEEVVVTARKSAESQQRVPIAITTVTAQTLKDLSVRDVYELQKVTPGMFITSSGTAGRAKLTIRGQTELDVRLTTDPSIGIYIDGVNWTRDYGLRTNLVDIEQVEVLKGPQGTLFGKNTTGGALNITTNHPTYTLGGYADLLYGSYNNKQATGVINAPLVDDKVALRLVGQVISRDGYGHAYNGQDMGDDHTWTGRALLRADPTDKVNILLSGDYTRARNNGPAIILTNEDVMLQNANTATGTLGATAKQLGLDPTVAANRLTAYNAWRAYYDSYRNGNAYNSFASANPAYAPNPKLEDNLDHYGLSSTIEVDLGAVKLKSITSYRRLTKIYFQDADGTPFDLNFTRNQTRMHNVLQEVQLSSIDGVGLDWQAGLFYNHENGEEFAVNNTNDYVNVNNPNIQDAVIDNIGKAAYAQAVYNFSPTLRMTAGIRFTGDTRKMDSRNNVNPLYAEPPMLSAPSTARCNLLTPTLGGPVFPNCSYKVSVSFHKPTWLISADWRPVETTMVYASVSTGYRTGGFTYQGSAAVQPSLNALNAAFTPYQPETVTNYEAGFKSDVIPRRLRINGAVYYQDYKNVQQSVLDQVNTVNITLIRNAASATLYGGELELTAAPIDGLTLEANTSYLDARFDTFVARNSAGAILDLSARPFSAPKWTYNLGVAYTIPVPDGSVRLNANWAWTGTVNLSPQATDYAGVTQKAYGLLDARINWHIDRSDLDIALFGKNLTDTRYLLVVVSSEASGYDNGVYGAPRTVGVQVRKTF